MEELEPELVPELVLEELPPQFAKLRIKQIAHINGAAGRTVPGSYFGKAGTFY